MCHSLAEDYLGNLRSKAYFCQAPGILRVNKNKKAMINYNMEKLGVLELGIGLSCCPAPPEEKLGTIWDRHRPSLIKLLESLQGIHVTVENIGNAEPFVVHIKETGQTSTVTEYGHFWALLEEGQYTVVVSVYGFEDKTKLVSVSKASFTNVKFVLPESRPTIPFFVLLVLLGTGVTLFLMVFLYCKKRLNFGSSLKNGQSSGHSRSHNGFQLLGRRRGGEDSNLFFHDEEEDDEEEEFEFMTNGMASYGLKPNSSTSAVAAARVYRDEPSSEEEGETLLSNGLKARRLKNGI